MGRPKTNTGAVEPEETKVDEAVNDDPKIVVEKVTVTEQPEKKNDMVEIKREDFEKMLKQMEKQSKDIDLLYKTADKGRMAKELNKEGENLIKKVKVRTWDDTGKLIIGWKLITNRCEIVMGRWTEDQTTTMIFEDGEVLTVPLLEFYRKTLKKEEAEIISKTDQFDENRNKVIIYKLQFPNGKTLSLNEAFVN
jgi:hypothetical protein